MLVWGIERLTNSYQNPRRWLYHKPGASSLESNCYREQEKHDKVCVPIAPTLLLGGNVFLELSQAKLLKIYKCLGRHELDMASFTSGYQYFHHSAWIPNPERPEDPGCLKKHVRVMSDEVRAWNITLYGTNSNNTCIREPMVVSQKICVRESNITAHVAKSIKWWDDGW